MKSTIYDCKVVQLPKVSNRAGNLTSIENNSHMPFAIKRVYYLYDVPGGEDRGGHAHKSLQQFIIAASGAFDVLIDDGLKKTTIRLDKPYMGLYIVPGIWRDLVNFSSGAVCLVLASELYDELDYIKDYSTFLNYRNEIYKL